MPHRLFIYGTLKRKMRNSALTQALHYLGEDETLEAIWNMHVIDDIEYPYPAITKDGTYRISGEVYRLDDQMLRALDQFECAVPNTDNQEYTRKSVQLSQHGKAYVYIGLPSLVEKALSCHDFRINDSNILKWIER